MLHLASLNQADQTGSSAAAPYSKVAKVANFIHDFWILNTSECCTTRFEAWKKLLSCSATMRFADPYYLFLL
jgi:hypothetical protein